MLPVEFVLERKSLGMTQTEFGEALGLSLRAIQKLENGESQIRKIHQMAIEWLKFLRAPEDPKAVTPLSLVHSALLLEAQGYQVIHPDHQKSAT